MIITCVSILLKVKIQDSGIRLLDIMKANFEGMSCSSMFHIIPPKSASWRYSLTCGSILTGGSGEEDF